ncbi:Methylthioribose-1-phosphate isomerase [Venturia nashicola]|uniref:Methylthioribose-1-phosphate isomerase n=1 Tax=Venturia nashicola TaxID=86259 RepID=A0A4Z1PMA4_9PEZI|nr:Methylthioribose-1-phosphate isomerase [Venturia nashicola]TLD39064.1 Methylthioribose-1-phosphate isomerase [Venturia nashicola]
MRSTGLFFALAASVVAQDLGQLPPCATACVGNSLSSTGCGQLNVSCICNSAGWIAGLSCCIAGGCSDADKAATIKFAQNICLPVGVTLPSAAVCPTGASSTATGSSNATKTGTASATAAKASASKAGAAPTAAALGYGAGIAGLAGLLAAAL